LKFYNGGGLKKTRAMLLPEGLEKFDDMCMR